MAKKKVCVVNNFNSSFQFSRFFREIYQLNCELFVGSKDDKTLNDRIYRVGAWDDENNIKMNDDYDGVISIITNEGEEEVREKISINKFFNELEEGKRKLTILGDPDDLANLSELWERNIPYEKCDMGAEEE